MLAQYVGASKLHDMYDGLCELQMNGEEQWVFTKFRESGDGYGYLLFRWFIVDGVIEAYFFYDHDIDVVCNVMVSSVEGGSDMLHLTPEIFSAQVNRWFIEALKEFWGELPEMTQIWFARMCMV